jgi:hypothetical protein
MSSVYKRVKDVRLCSLLSITVFVICQLVSPDWVTGATPSCHDDQQPGFSVSVRGADTRRLRIRSLKNLDVRALARTYLLYILIKKLAINVILPILVRSRAASAPIAPDPHSDAP